MPSCSVKWCSNHTSTCSLKSKNGVSFHRFPKDEVICQKWVEAVRLERRDPWWTSSNASRICSLHFKESDISSTPCKVNILAKTAVPICTMVWYYNNENMIPPKTVNTILRTYERKKSSTNVLKESKVNLSYNWNKEDDTTSNTNTIVISNMTQDSLAQATELIKTLEVFESQNLKEGLESNSDANRDLKTSDNVNVTAPQNKTVLSELNKKEYIKSCKEQCCKSILVKLNDNTNLILDEDLDNDSNTNFKESNIVGKEPNLRTFRNSKKVSLKELKSNENKEPNQEVTSMSNSDMFEKTIKSGNEDLDTNISKSYVSKMLKTYLPKRKDKIIEKHIREMCKHIPNNRGLNTVKCKEVNNIPVNKCFKDNFNKKLNIGISIKTNIIPNLQPNKNFQEQAQHRVFKNVKKYTIKRNDFFNRPRIREKNKQTVDVEPNKGDNKESNITHIDEFISNLSRMYNIKETDTAVYDEIISEMLEPSNIVENVSDIPSNGNYEESNEKIGIESNAILHADNNMDTVLDKGTNNLQVILDLDTNIYTELNKLIDLELCSEMNTCEIDREDNTNKMVTNQIFPQFNENIVTKSNQQMSIMNKNMPKEQRDHLIPESNYYLHTEINGNSTQCNESTCYNENITTNSIIISDNELQSIEKSFVNNIVTKKDEFTELKRHLSMRPKLDSLSELCANTLTDVHKNLYDNVMSTAITKENIQVSDRDHNAEFVKNTDIELNDIVTSLHSKINADANNTTDSNVTPSKELNSILLEEFITNLSLESNNSESINLESDINTECKNIREKDMPDLNTVMNLELCNEANIAFNDEKNTLSKPEKTGVNAGLAQHNKNIGTELIQNSSIMNRNMPMAYYSHSISESDYYLHTKMNKNITTHGNKNICRIENITNNTQIISNNKMQNLDTPGVNNIVIETRKDEFTELKKHLSTKPNLDSFVELCTNTLVDNEKDLFSKHDRPTAITKKNIQVLDRGHNAEFIKNSNIDENDMDTSLQNNINNNTTTETESEVSSFKQFNSILLEELMPNISPDSNFAENKNFINNLKTNPNTTLNNKMISDINIECKKIVEKDIELNTVILSELNEDQAFKTKEVIKRKFHNLNTTDKDLLLRKSNKDSINVLTTSDDQHTAVNEHMDVVDSILNRDIAAEFDLSLLLSDTPLPDEDIQNMDISNNNSLDGIGGSPNWIQLPTCEMPKIIDDILEQNSPYFENLDLFDKVHKFNIDKEANKKDKEIKKLIKNSNFEQFEEQIITNFCEIDKRSTKNSIAQIKKQFIAEFFDCNDSSLEQSNNICNENEVNQSKEVTAEKCYNLYDNQNDKQKLEQYFHPNNEQCHRIEHNQIVEKCTAQHSDKEIQSSDKILNQFQKQNHVDTKAKQMEDSSSNLYFGPNFEKSEKSRKGRDGLEIDKPHDEVLNDVNILEMSKKQYDKKSNEQTYQPSVGKLINMEELTLKSKIRNQDTLESTFQEISKQLSEDFNEKNIDKVNNVSNEEHTAGIENVRELNVGQLKRAIFEQCYDPECRNDCKNQKHNSNTETHNNVKQREKQTNLTPCQPDIEQCNQSNIDNLKKHLNHGTFDPNIIEMKSKCFLESQKLSCNEKFVPKYKKIAIGHIPGKYLELRWKEGEEKSNKLSQEGCKRKHKELGLDQRKILCRESSNNFFQQIMAECPECGYTTDNNDLMNYKSDVDLRITKPLSLINKDMLISLRESENNENNNRVALESVYAMELAYVTAIQALERKLKQKIAISEYRLKRVNNLSKINNTLIKANIILKGFHKNKM